MPYVASVFGRVSVVASTVTRTGLIVLSFVVAANVVVDHGAHSQVGPPDLIIVNARIYTVDRTFSTAQAVAIAANTSGNVFVGGLGGGSTGASHWLVRKR